MTVVTASGPSYAFDGSPELEDSVTENRTLWSVARLSDRNLNPHLVGSAFEFWASHWT